MDDWGYVAWVTNSKIHYYPFNYICLNIGHTGSEVIKMTHNSTEHKIYPSNKC